VSEENQTTGVMWKMAFVSFLAGFLVMLMLKDFVFPAEIREIKLFEGDGIRAIRVEKIGADSIFVLPDPNSSECYGLWNVLEKKFGGKQSAERVIYEAKVKELVGWYGDGKKEKR